MTNRTVFAFETLKPPERFTEKRDEQRDKKEDLNEKPKKDEDLEDGEIREDEAENKASAVPDSDASSSCKNNDPANSPEENSWCTICLEDWDRDLMKHTEETCKMVMCNQCIEVKIVIKSSYSFLRFWVVLLPMMNYGSVNLAAGVYKQGTIKRLPIFSPREGLRKGL